MTIVITGGSGFIGTMLAQKLLALGDTIIIVDITAPSFTHPNLYFIQCDITTAQLPFNVLEQTDAVVNLVGKSIATKWTEKSKTEIRNSRIISTMHVVESMKNAINRPTILINASAVGIYGERDGEELTEQSSPGEGFLAEVVRDWEAQAYKASEFGVRVVCIRTAPVLGQMGILPSIRKMTRMGLMFSLSKIDFWQPWVHEDDIVNAYLFALQTSTLQGPVNAAAPQTIKHSVFMKILANKFKKRLIGVLPNLIKKIFIGGSVNDFVKSQKVIPQRLVDKGFIFQYPNLEEAVSQIIKIKK